MTATIYTTKTCAYCPLVAKWLTSKGVAFTKIELDNKPELRQELLKLTGAMTVPITKIGNTWVVGWNVKALTKALEDSK